MKQPRKGPWFGRVGALALVVALALVLALLCRPQEEAWMWGAAATVLALFGGWLTDHIKVTVIYPDPEEVLRLMREEPGHPRCRCTLEPFVECEAMHCDRQATYVIRAICDTDPSINLEIWSCWQHVSDMRAFTRNQASVEFIEGAEKDGHIRIEVDDLRAEH